MIGRDVVRAVTRALVASVEAQAPAEARAMRDAVERLVAAPDQAAWQLAAPEVEAALDALAARRIRIGRAAAPHLPKPPRRELALHDLPPPYDVHTGYDGLEVWRNRARLGLPQSLFAEVPARRGSHWAPAELVYEARLPCGDGELAVPRHDGTEIDWWSADATKPLTLKRGPKRSAIPARFEYPGAPHPRWWQIEDRSVDIGGYPPDRGHLTTLLLIDLISSHANDWFVWGLEVPGGSVAALRDVVVWDVFGRKHALAVPADWSLYAVEGLGPATVFVPQTTATPLVGDLQDEAVLGVDEDSNVLWGVVVRHGGLPVNGTPPGRARTSSRTLTAAVVSSSTGSPT